MRQARCVQAMSEADCVLPQVLLVAPARGTGTRGFVI